MDYEEYSGAEEQDVADPVTEGSVELEEGAEEQEPAEPVTQNSPEPDAEAEQQARRQQDAAFAQMRRQYEEANRRAQIVSQQLQRTTSVLREMGFQGDTDDYVIDSALAHMQGRSVEEVRNERMTAQREQIQREALQKELNDAIDREAERLEEFDFNVFSKIDPSLKSLKDAERKYPAYFKALGKLSREEMRDDALRETLFRAAVGTVTSKEAATPPKIGKVNGDAKIEREYFTNKELNNLTAKELDDPVLLEKAIKSLQKLKS